MMKHALKVGVAVVFCATAFACGDDGGESSGGTGAVGGVAGAMGGMSGGMSGGTGGVTGGTGGMSGGTGGMTGGTGGMTGGMGGAAGMMGGMGGMGGAPVTGDPTWSAIFSEVVMAKGCNQGAQCHGGAGGGLMMADKDSAYAALVGIDAMGVLPGFPNCSESGLKRVVAMDPDASLLVQKVEGMPTCGVQMPPGGPNVLIPQAQRDQIRMWIMNGALNN